ncbi:MAG: glycosyltransferase family protein [Actinomycetota bacterium]
MGRSETLRVLHFSFPYPQYVRQFYESRPGLSRRTFDEQDTELKADHFGGASPGWPFWLTKLGYETRDHSASIKGLQETWAREHRIEFGPDRWMLDIARAQVLDFNPHVLAINPQSVPKAWLRELRNDAASLKIVLSRYSSPDTDVDRFALSDLVLSGDRRQVDQLRARGIRAVLQHHGFDTRVLDRLPASATCEHDVLFTGQLHRQEGFHLYRAEVLKALSDAGVPLELRLLASESDRTERIKLVARRAAWKMSAATRRLGVSERTIARMPGLSRALSSPRPPRPLDRQLRRSIATPIFGLEMYRTLAASRVALNVHADVSVEDANNLRLWEATGVGTCLLTDAKQNLDELFEVGKEIVAFDSSEDCVEKARWLLSDPAARAEIAAAGQRRTLRDHTYEQRVIGLDEAIREAMDNA